MTDTVLLGPQSSEPNVQAALDRLGIDGRLCILSAGWQEREGELADLREQIANPIADLAVYARCEEAFAHDQALFDANRERQDTLIAMQRLYRIRLSHAIAAARELVDASAPAALLDAARRAANLALRGVDRHHLRQIRSVHARFQDNFPLVRSPVLRRHRAAIAEQIDDCEAVLIAGGHAAVLLGRLRLLDFAGLTVDKPIIAWSAGAMALTDRVVLFHDHPPQGAGDPEVLDAGLARVPTVIALPNARDRLALNDIPRVAMFARRFAPARALTLDSGSMLHYADGRLTHVERVAQLQSNGSLVVAQAT